MDMSKKLPQGWKEVLLKDICKTMHQGINTVADKVEYIDSGKPIIQSKNITSGYLDLEDVRYVSEINYNKYKEKYNPRYGDILFCNIGTIGKSYVIDEDKGFLIAWNLFLIRVEDSICNSKYLKYFFEFLYRRDFYSRLLTGGTVKFINKKKLGEIKIPLLPLKEQETIVSILERVENAIYKRQESNRLLDEYLKSVFVEMFGDPATNPKGWDKGIIRDLVLEAKYGSSKKADEFNGQFPILRMNNITYQGNWDFTSLKYIDLDEKEQEKYLVNKGDMLFNRTNSKELVGKTAVYRKETPMAYAGYLVRVRANEKANTEFISAYLNTDYCKEVLQNMCKNIVGMANINAQEMQDIKIYIPPIEIQERFAQIVYNVESMKKKNINSSEELNNLFNSLMQRLFNGDL